MSNVLTRALALYARVLGKKFGINVVFSDISTAATDGKTVYIGRAYAGLGTQKMATTMFGLVAHETMHLLLTDFSALKRWHEKVVADKGNWEIIKHLQNTCEDVWGEREFCRIYPTVWVDIVDSTVNMRNDGLYGPPTLKGPPEHPASVFMNWWLAENLAAHYKLEPFRADARKWKQACSALLGDEVVAGALKLAETLANVKSTEEAFQLAQQVYQLIKQTAIEQQQQLDKNQKPAAGDQSPGTSTDSAEQVNAESVKAESVVKALNEVLDASADDLAGCKTEKGDALQEVRTLHSQSATAGMEHYIEDAQTIDADEAFLKKRTEIRSSLTGRLERLLQANADVAVEYRTRGTRIAGARLALIKTGVIDVFERSDIGEDLDTVVDVVIDASGSMRNIWTQTLAAGYAVADALATFHVPIGVVQFGSSISRCHEFGKRWNSHSQKVPLMAGGGTRTAEAIYFSANKLLDQPQSRRLMIVITDGEPSDAESAVAIAKEAQFSGIDIVHVFLGNYAGQYIGLLKDAKVGSYAKCHNSNDSLGLAKAIESAIAKAFARYLKLAA